MRIKITYIFVITFLSVLNFAALAQKQGYIDSLQSQLITAKDSRKIALYNGLSWAYKFSNPNLAFEYASNSYELSTQFNNNVGKAISLNRMGAAKLNLGELDIALGYMLEAYELSDKNKLIKIKTTSLRQIGEVYEAQGNIPEAMRYYYNSLSIADSIGKPVGIARSALKVAGLYIKIEKYNNAKMYLAYAIDEFEKDGFLRGLHQAYLLKGDYYSHQNIADSALINYDKALTYLVTLKDKQGYATVIAKKAKVYEYQGKFNESISGYFEALDTFKTIGDKKEIVYVYVSLALAYQHKLNYKKAIYYANLAKSQAQQLGLPNEKKEAFYRLFEIYKTTNKQSLALNYLESYMFLMDSLIHSSESWRVEQMRKSYDLEMQLKENKLKAAIIANQALTIENNKLLRNFLIILVSVVCMLTVLIWYWLNHSKKINKQLTIANEEKNEAISLISHDLKSPFNKIKGLTHLLELELNSNEDSIKELLSKINIITHEGLSLVQNLVDIKALNSGSYHIKNSLFELNEFLQQRVQGFEQVAKSKNIKLNYHGLESNCNVLSGANSVARIFDNILSNAIKFSPEGGTIGIDCSIQGNSFSFSISDNGIGIDQNDINKIFGKYKTGEACPTGSELSSGLGLAIASSLIRKLKGSIDCISEKGKGATFIVSLPLNKEGEAT